jgi:phosphosulfolactate synthase (CoM biosynthesis protein A)
MFFRDKKIVREFLEMFPDYEIKTFLGGIRDV